jgi:hypothetical protein
MAADDAIAHGRGQEPGEERDHPGADQRGIDFGRHPLPPEDIGEQPTRTEKAVAQFEQPHAKM